MVLAFLALAQVWDAKSVAIEALAVLLKAFALFALAALIVTGSGNAGIRAGLLHSPSSKMLKLFVDHHVPGSYIHHHQRC
jgi:hypothetical protein